MIGVSYAPIVAIINVINGKILNPAWMQKTLNMISDCFEETGIFVVLNCSGRKNLTYASIAGIIRESGF